jgi:hypothetical protein
MRLNEQKRERGSRIASRVVLQFTNLLVFSLIALCYGTLGCFWGIFDIWDELRCTTS